MILLMCGHHSFIYPLSINVFSTLNAECEIEWSTSCCVCALCENVSFIVWNTATFI